MAGNVRGFLRLNIGLARNIFLKNNSFNGGLRFLYTERSLGINGYENARLGFRNQFMNVESTFRTKMQEICNDEKSMIFTEDLKAMLHLVQKKEEDLELLVKMMEKFNSQNKELRFGNFIFGPVVMRTLYYLDEPDIALTMFKDPKLDTFFDQMATYQILMCLLFKHQKYGDIKNVYDIIKAKQLNGSIHPRNSLIMVSAACYKENTPEAFQYALDLWKDLNTRGIDIMRRAIIFFTALAINQNAPHIAIEMLSSVRESRYIDIRCLKVLAYAHMSRFMEIIPILRLSLEYDRPHAKKECYFADVIALLEDKLSAQNMEENSELHRLIDLIKKQDHIINTQSLDDRICSPIDNPRNIMQKNVMQQFATQRQQRFKTRPGLRSFL